MTTERTGPVATKGDGTPPQECVKGNRPAEEPSLAAMTQKAIRLLQGSPNGFFLTYGTAGGNPAADAPPSQQHTGSAVPI
jgi:hypothetical protein